MRFFEEVLPFRMEYMYSNNVFVVAARLAEDVTGQTWEENVRNELLLVSIIKVLLFL